MLHLSNLLLLSDISVDESLTCEFPLKERQGFSGFVLCSLALSLTS